MTQTELLAELAALKAAHGRLRRAAEAARDVLTALRCRDAQDSYLRCTALAQLRTALDASPASPEPLCETFDPAAVRELLAAATRRVNTPADSSLFEAIDRVRASERKP